MDRAVPAQATCRIWITTGQVSIPAAGNFASITVRPTYVPTIDCCSAIVSDSDSGSEAIIPLVSHYISTLATVRSYAAGTST